MLKKLVPRWVKKTVRERHQQYVLEKSVNRFARLNRESAAPSRKLLSELVYGWGNEGFSAEWEYLASVAEHANHSRGPILECGSGLSTILLGLIAKQNGNSVWTLEHLPEWAERVRSSLEKFSIDSVELCVAPLRDSNEFDWYDAPLDKMPNGFSLVVCDGPPGDTRGGRYGMLPVMRRFLSADCIIILDDAAREGEKTICEKWARELGTSVRITGLDKPFAVLMVQ